MESIISNLQNKNPINPEPKKENFLIELIKFTVITLAVVLPIRWFVAEPYIVVGASMDPTFESNQYIIVDQLSYQFGDPSRGQVVIFHDPLNIKTDFIKRVIGLPGETVHINGEQVTITNEAGEAFVLDEPYISDSNQKKNQPTTLKLKSGEYFVMGDNRAESFDSRSWGVLPRKLIVGTPFVRLYPLNKIGFFPGNYKENN